MTVGMVVATGVVMSTAGTIQTGNVGIRTTLGVISAEEIGPGVYFKWPLISSVHEFSAKDIVIDMSDLTPKAKDNLSLRDMDVSIYYRTSPGSISELSTKYASQSARHTDGYFMPAYELVWRIARNACYEEIAKLDSLVIHTQREQLGVAIAKKLQEELDRNDPGVFVVSRAVIRSVQTDPSIEQSIQQAVANQKKLEAMQVQTEIAKREADIKVTEARGIAESNQIIAGSLTREYLQHEANLALFKFAEKGNSNTIVVPSGMSVAPLINTGK
ncbi:SPFH domain-containing protein [Methyloversatilis sp. MC4-4]|uniref:SPFH domain-containing protein n=1 Tax=Methyloversatilis sp. MC4-4 TaxID=3132824 RepID=UPI003CF0968E